ncbi:MAG: ATP-binding cassette domain-containing protein [Peptoclostridium sp.]|uniref:ABC transporter ATP-binding protein n=1 Tax=Peptoclostridium sp. TaxID=1904860 RepID=UPI00139C21A5|nr:ABC transporter ATP-binding protein [Peptoclostridium sp.]MZQ75360.1 ATP-binding cassette domain-containing protein [Peptoclostridium sp.]
MHFKIDNISFKYKNSGSNIIDSFSLELEKGATAAILGGSGSGKSTLLRLIAGLETPLKGNIILDGQTLSGDSIFVQPEKRGVGMVFQDYALFPHLTVAQNITFGLRKLGAEHKAQRLEEMLKLIELEDKQNKYPHELSGGQQQRVAFARAVAPEPSLLLLDEPFSNLDAELKSRIRLEFKKLLEKLKITSVFVTHDIEDAISISTKTIYLDSN